MQYANIYILGTGRVAKMCQKIAWDFFDQEIILIPYNQNLDDFFKHLKDCLIISANNFYIFKKECVLNNTIINYHNALLPKHKGCNAHLWSIWENDDESGISWHLVDENIDTGAILIQKKLKIERHFTALKLLQKQHELAIDSFKKALQNLKNKRFKIQTSYGGGYHKKSEFPNECFLELSWDIEKIDRFLRALDCGGLTKAKIKILGTEKEILLYQINEFDLILNLSDNTILKITKENNANC
ncbi:formyltransferase family protein [Campylobacter aviculae]|uniref:phosphoribosylglycinamide formyltransferase 1 n=1 Tax=Campylobacter aviculae TaxID=2510190 RepID=A0A4U7BWA2_9BACT|nr:formyltransferase family protein [Campylobacter aviculae]TKX32837.1 formyl transferase [Campylobacter aviculae]